jgi:cell division protein FtsW
MTAATIHMRTGKASRGARPAVVSAFSDPVLLGFAAALLAFGLVMVASASISIAERDTGMPFYFLQKQMVFAVAGFAGGWLATLIPMRVWERLGMVALAVALLLLVLVLVPGIGREVNNAQRWISLGFFGLQASEPARLLILMYLASYLVRYEKSVREEFRGFAKPMAILGVAAVLLLLQPDFGAAVVLLVAALGMIFVGGVLLRHFAAVGAIVTLAMTAMVWISPYRLRRLLGFTDPWADPYDSGFQLTNSLIAIGRGEWLGVGLGGSVQKLFYLPEAHTDFLFAVYAEEFGLVGTVALVAAFLVVAWRALAIGRASAQAGRMYGAYLAFGIGTWLGVQSFVNIGVNMGVLPTKGLTLPLMSYGGSSLLVCCTAIGLLLRVAHEARPVVPVERAR